MGSESHIKFVSVRSHKPNHQRCMMLCVGRDGGLEKGIRDGGNPTAGGLSMSLDT
jgi:hypothetical protein